MKSLTLGSQLFRCTEGFFKPEMWGKVRELLHCSLEEDIPLKNILFNISVFKKNKNMMMMMILIVCEGG